MTQTYTGIGREDLHVSKRAIIMDASWHGNSFELTSIIMKKRVDWQFYIVVILTSTIWVYQAYLLGSSPCLSTSFSIKKEITLLYHQLFSEYVISNLKVSEHLYFSEHMIRILYCVILAPRVYTHLTRVKRQPVKSIILRPSIVMPYAVSESFFSFYWCNP